MIDVSYPMGSLTAKNGHCTSCDTSHSMVFERPGVSMCPQCIVDNMYDIMGKEIKFKPKSENQTISFFQNIPPKCLPIEVASSEIVSVIGVVKGAFLAVKEIEFENNKKTINLPMLTQIYDAKNQSK